jgi:gas vesicle protein
MKKSTKLLAAASLAAGGAIGVLLAPEKGSETRKKLNQQLRRLKALSNGEWKREKLVMVKDKLEEHKEKLEKHLQKIDAMIKELDARKKNAEKN